MPSDKNQYVHRLGRTARAGKTGDGVLLLADFERFFLNGCKDQPIKVREQLWILIWFSISSMLIEQKMTEQ